MNPPSVSPQQAADQLASDPSTLYIDVRTVEEFTQRHPPGAWNLPVFLADPATGRMMPNPEFKTVAQTVLDPSIPLLIACAAGQRSLHAISVLESCGYDATNVDGGFSGRRDPFGNVIQKGWAQLQLPTETGDGGDTSWFSLRNR